MSNTKTVFIAFAIEDQRQRDLLKGQSLCARSPFDFVDMSVKEPHDTNWKEHVRSRIRRSHGVIALIAAAHLFQRSKMGDCLRKGGGEKGPRHLGLYRRPY